MIEHLIREVSAGLAVAGEDFKATVKGLDDASFGGPTALPGWSRAHVVAHAEGISRAMQRQVEHAVQGETIELYDGGFDGRVQAIEARAQRDPLTQKEALVAAVDDAIGAFEHARDHWEAKISYRDGTVYDGALALWRELVIHASDLDAGTTSRDWSDRFCHYLIDFLAARVPSGTVLKLQPLGEEPITIQGTPNDGAAPANDDAAHDAAAHTVVVTGALQDIAAWLAGREPVGGLEATDAAAAADTVDLPELLSWPAALTPR
ncbi:maleylpyruvate isomerase family mycothiol-dependent enzyme [Arthrobacter sp. Hz1]